MSDENNQLLPVDENTQVQPKRRGRPRKNPLPENAPQENIAAEPVSVPSADISGLQIIYSHNLVFLTLFKKTT